jgi:hypothetical protein
MVDAYDGRCGCGEVRFRVTTAPLIVHACHCRYCQRETGSAFVINALVETSRVELLAGVPERVVTRSASGKGQTIVRCSRCHIAVWSHYPQTGELLAFIRVGTLDNPDRWPPDIHIYTSTKQPARAARWCERRVSFTIEDDVVSGCVVADVCRANCGRPNVAISMMCFLSACGRRRARVRDRETRSRDNRSRPMSSAR